MFRCRPTPAMRFSHEFIGFPFGSIIRNALRFKAPPEAALWIRENRVSVHFSQGRRSSYLGNAGNTPGAPLLLNPVRRNTEFGNQILRGNRMKKDGRFALVIDHPDSIFSLVQTKNLSIDTVDELYRLPVETLLPTPALPDSFEWEILSPELEPLPAMGPLPSSVVMVGLPQKVCWWAEKWVESVDGILMGVWPALLATLHWCRLRTPAFALLPGKTNSYLALFVGERLHLLTKLPASEWLFGSLVEPLVEEIRRELQIPFSPLCIYPGEILKEQLESFLSRFQQPFRVFGPQQNSNVTSTDIEASVLRHTFSAATL